MSGSPPFANGSRPPFALRQPHRDGLRRAAAYGLAGCLTAVLGPLGTFDRMTLPVRAAFWTAAIVFGWLQFSVAAWVFAPGRPARYRPTPAQFVAITLLASVPITLELEFLNHALTGDAVAWGALPFGYAASVLVGGIVYGLSLAIDRDVPAAPEAAGDPSPAPKSAARPQFLDRVPAAARGTLLALEMEDHYLRVHTSAGSALILYRMTDAVAELADAGGLRVHRSWWAAGNAVAAVERRDGRTWLRLANGLAVPVARASVAAVRALGWGDSGGGAAEHPLPCERK